MSPDWKFMGRESSKANVPSAVALSVFRTLRTAPFCLNICRRVLPVPPPGSAMKVSLVILPLQVKAMPLNCLISPSCVVYWSLSSEPLPRTSSRLGNPFVNALPARVRRVALKCKHCTFIQHAACAPLSTHPSPEPREIPSQ